MQTSRYQQVSRRSAWHPRRTVPFLSARCLQLAIGRVVFDSPCSRLGSSIASVFALRYAQLVERLAAPGRVRILLGPEVTAVVGLPSRFYPRGGICVGKVFLTGPNPSPELLRHEAKHAAQWQTYGLAMPLLYWLAGADAHNNWFEVEAGLKDGGYL